MPVWPDSKSLETLACVGIDIVITRCHMLELLEFRIQIHRFTDSHCFLSYDDVCITILRISAKFWVSYSYGEPQDEDADLNPSLECSNTKGQTYQPWKWGVRI